MNYSPSASGPSERFYDFLDLTRILEKGYTYVMVDLPGYGGSGGCNDWGGPREQGAVKAAVYWVERDLLRTTKRSRSVTTSADTAQKRRGPHPIRGFTGAA